MVFILDNGHGGVINSVYQTEGKRSPLWSNGSQLFEGEFNRAIVNRIVEQLGFEGIPYINLVPEYKDISLATRVKRANRLDLDLSKSLLISIHANAAPKRIQGQGRGVEVYTSPTETSSDKYATALGESFKRNFQPLDVRLRTDYTDGDLDKEAKFKILTKTRMPAILTENFFMDNEHECKNYLLTTYGRDMIAEYHLDAIREIYYQWKKS